MLFTIQAFTIVWLVFGLSFVFMINLLMMDHIRNFSKKLVQSSKKSIRKLRKYTRRSTRVGSLKIKKVMQKKWRRKNPRRLKKLALKRKRMVKTVR